MRRMSLLLLLPLAWPMASAAANAVSMAAYAFGAAGTGAGGTATLVTSLASAEAGTLLGGAYQLDGGFWLGGDVAPVAVAPTVSARLLFLPPAPNPSAGSTQLAFSIPEAQPVLLEVFSLNGRRIDTLLDQRLPAGEHSLIWAGSDKLGIPVSSGIYFLRLRAGRQELTRRVVRLHP